MAVPDLTDEIEQYAAEPKKASGDGGSMERHPLSELIEADKYLKNKEAANNPRRGIRYTKLVPPGTV